MTMDVSCYLRGSDSGGLAKQTQAKETAPESSKKLNKRLASAIPQSPNYMHSMIFSSSPFPGSSPEGLLYFPDIHSYHLA